MCGDFPCGPVVKTQLPVKCLILGQDTKILHAVGHSQKVKKYVYMIYKYVYMIMYISYIMKSLSHVQLFATPWTVAYRLLLPWDFPGKNTGVGCHFLLQEIFPAQGLNTGPLHCRQTLYHLSHQGCPM